ncbi:hypothetical protein FV232_27690 [Methylobacterium sp. WL30]|nr:hypothetical protein FV225_28430 [Methylobacterium sp. WL93]TXN43998.1 hypothetical protein FV227_27285 [Methylobacterium sp. WL119]TXN60986.1 hypothetical protein FV232_27690 [Methylobacterium sp. WL30]
MAAIEAIAADCKACSLWWSSTIRTARARTFRGIRWGSLRHRSTLLKVGASGKPGAVQFLCTIGLARAQTKIGLANLAYNLKRFLWFKI